LCNRRGRKPARNPLAEENQKLNAQMAHLQKRLQRAELIIEVQNKLSALLGITLPETSRKEGNS
jgi:cell shape-determining protein MreC